MNRIFFQQIHDVPMRNLPGKDEPRQVLLMLDEFFALGWMTSLASKIAVSAGYGFRMASILQDLSQLDELYGKATREPLTRDARPSCSLRSMTTLRLSTSQKLK